MNEIERFLSELISTTEAAEIMQCHRSTVERNLVANGGTIQAKKIADTWVVVKSTVPVPVTSPTIVGRVRRDVAA